MRRSVMVIAAVLGLVISITSTTWTRGVEPQSGKGVFAGLKVGLPVTLKDVGAAYEVSLLDEPITTGQKVDEVGVDYLVIKNEAGIETRIPLTSIKAVIPFPHRRFRFPRTSDLGMVHPHHGETRRGTQCAGRWVCPEARPPYSKYC
jgi:hypothetical protein